VQTTAKALRLYGSIRFKADRQMIIYLVRRRDLSMGLMRVGAHGQKKIGTELGAALDSVVALGCLLRYDNWHVFEVGTKIRRAMYAMRWSYLAFSLTKRRYIRQQVCSCVV